MAGGVVGRSNNICRACLTCLSERFMAGANSAQISVAAGSLSFHFDIRTREHRHGEPVEDAGPSSERVSNPSLRLRVRQRIRGWPRRTSQSNRGPSHDSGRRMKGRDHASPA